MDKYIVWFVGTDTEKAGLCEFVGNTTAEARNFANSQADSNMLPDEAYVVCKLVEVE